MVRQVSLQPYIPALDGLRGLAVILVMLFHVRIPPFDRGGFLGVDVFFCLSGFLITTLLLRELQETGTIHFRNFYMRRILRLAPALILMLLFFNLYSTLFLDPIEAQINRQSSLFALFYVGNIVKAYGIDSMSTIGHTWSLSMEEQFYVLFPVFFFWLMRTVRQQRSVMMVLMALALVSWGWGALLIASGVPWPQVHFAPHTRFYEILIGCALAVYLAPWGVNALPLRWGKRVSASVAWVAFIALLIVAVFTNAEDPVTYYGILAGVSALTVILILYVIKPGDTLLKRVLEMRWLMLLGRISYGLYLYHQLVFQLFLPSENRRLFIGVPVSIALALVSFYFIERPILRLKSRYSAVESETYHVTQTPPSS